MPGILYHSPADILRELLISLGIGVDPDDGTDANWPIFATQEPNLPDNVITVYNSDGISHGREQIGGEQQYHHGIQVRIRATTTEVGNVKAYAVKQCFDETIYQNAVTLGEYSYLVHALSKTSNVIELGPEAPVSERVILVINGYMSVRLA